MRTIYYSSLASRQHTSHTATHTVTGNCVPRPEMKISNIVITERPLKQ